VWAGVSPAFNKGRIFQWFGEVATFTDNKPCSDMGTGDQGNDTLATGRAQISSASFVNGGGALPVLNVRTEPNPQPNGQYSAALIGTSTRTFAVGGPGSNPPNTAVGTKGLC
jgi:hypothetical protein